MSIDVGVEAKLIRSNGHAQGARVPRRHRAHHTNIV